MQKVDTCHRDRMPTSVIHQTGEGVVEHLRRLAKSYLGTGKYYYSKPNHKRVILKIRPEKIMEILIRRAICFLASSLCG